MFTDVAELVLRKCTASNAKDKNIQPDSEDYTVTFNYEFIEDKDHAHMYASCTCVYMHVHYRRSGFNREYLLIAICKFFYVS